MNRKKIGILGQTYEAPRAESVDIQNEGFLLSASDPTPTPPSDLDGGLPSFVEEEEPGLWGNP